MSVLQGGWVQILRTDRKFLVYAFVARASFSVRYYETAAYGAVSAVIRPLRAGIKPIPVAIKAIPVTLKAVLAGIKPIRDAIKALRAAIETVPVTLKPIPDGIKTGQATITATEVPVSGLMTTWHGLSRPGSDTCASRLDLRASARASPSTGLSLLPPIVSSSSTRT